MNPHLMSSYEKFASLNTLACVPHILLNHNTIIDLRNETSVIGTIKHVDGYMNIDMGNVVFIDQRNKQHPFDDFHIPHRMIRYIHIPESIPIGPAIEQFCAGVTNDKTQRREQRKKLQQSRQKTFKAKRAKDKHLQTLKDLAANSEQQQQKDNDDNVKNQS